MGYVCDFCGEQRSMIYCRSDAACLCLSCDRNVHSANTLSKRHSRTLLCERCHSQPALVRCAEERVSLCQNCDWTGHGTSKSASSHKRQTISCYSGCPSATELSSIWSFVLNSPAVGESACEQETGLMSIAENSAVNSWGSSETASGSVKGNDTPTKGKPSLWGASSLAELNSAAQGLDLRAGSTYATLPKLSCPGTKGFGLCENDDIYADFDMDEMHLNLESYDELFGVTLNNSEELFKNGGFDSLFGMDISGDDSNCQGAVAAAEGSLVGLVNAMQPACSNEASADSVMSNKTEPILHFIPERDNSNLSFTGPIGESSAGDYQDCGASPMFLMIEPPWCSPGPENSLQSTNRSDAVMRYKEKKKIRKFDKRVRYASRKARAEVRKRVQGRFVKAGEAYDYDPLNQTRSY